MHSSSSLTYFFKYYFPTGFVGLFIVTFILGDFSIHELSLALLPLVLLIPIYLLTLAQVRHVKAMKDKIITETLRYEEDIAYNQIIYVYQSALTKPALIRIAYTDQETGKIKKFYAIGSTSEQTFQIDPLHMNELAFTKYIRRKVKEANPTYDEANEPSRFTIPLTGIIIVLFSFVLGFILDAFFT